MDSLVRHKVPLDSQVTGNLQTEQKMVYYTLPELIISFDYLYRPGVLLPCDAVDFVCSN